MSSGHEEDFELFLLRGLALSAQAAFDANPTFGNFRRAVLANLRLKRKIRSLS